MAVERAKRGPRAAQHDSKAAGAFRTIREVAEELDVPQHVLRFWETKFSQIKPLKRGGGRRYYRPDDIGLLHRIRSLLYDEGYTIRGVQKLLREPGGRLSKAARARGLRKEEAEPPPPGESRLKPETRAELEAVMSELVTLRDMLRGRV